MVAIGAPWSDNNGTDDSGSAYVVFGAPFSTPVDLSTIGQPGTANGLRLDGASEGDTLGMSVAGIGDAGGSPLPDVIVGAPCADNRGRVKSVSRGPAEYAQLVRDCTGEGPVFLSFDIDVLDPAHAPATGTPEVGGLTSREALAFVRALAGIEFCGFDLVEVSPPYDNPGQTAAMLAANIAYELLGLIARHKSRR